MEDHHIVEQIRRNDPNGLSEVYSQYRSEFTKWIRRFAQCDEDDACEFFQAAVIIFYDNIRNGKIETLQSSIKTYLFGVGKKLVWQGNRSQARHQKIYAEYFLMEQIDSTNEPEDNLMEQNLELVSHCFERLGDPCHKLLDLFYYDQKSMDEIASELGYKNTDTAKTQKYKCMDRLRKMVEDERALNSIT